jgi:hypothetical protein
MGERHLLCSCLETATSSCSTILVSALITQNHKQIILLLAEYYFLLKHIFKNAAGIFLAFNESSATFTSYGNIIFSLQIFTLRIVFMEQITFVNRGIPGDISVVGFWSSMCYKIMKGHHWYFKVHWTYFNLSLSSIRGMVFKNLDCNNLICAFLPALHNLKRNWNIH